MCKWSAPVSDAIAYRRAGGRRRYHAHRRRLAEARRREVWRWFLQWQHLSGVQRRLANTFRVSLATISRDLKHLRTVHHEERTSCPTCGTPDMYTR
jgi:hypothetical protein